MNTRFQKLPAERQATILSAIFAEVAEHGFEKASVAGIAERAGTSKASLFYYFDDRDSMLAAAVAALFSDVLGLGKDAPPLSVPPSAEALWAGLEMAYRGVAERVAEDPVRAGFGREWLKLMSKEETPSILAPFVEQARAVVDQLVSAGLACGALRADLPRPLLVRTLFAVAVAADTWMADEARRGASVDELARPVMALVRSAFGAPAGAPNRSKARKATSGRRRTLSGQ